MGFGPAHPLGKARIEPAPISRTLARQCYGYSLPDTDPAGCHAHFRRARGTGKAAGADRRTRRGHRARIPATALRRLDAVTGRRAAQRNLYVHRRPWHVFPDAAGGHTHGAAGFRPVLETSRRCRTGRHDHPCGRRFCSWHAATARVAFQECAVPVSGRSAGCNRGAGGRQDIHGPGRPRNTGRQDRDRGGTVGRSAQPVSAGTDAGRDYR